MYRNDRRETAATDIPWEILSKHPNTESEAADTSLSYYTSQEGTLLQQTLQTIVQTFNVVVAKV